MQLFPDVSVLVSLSNWWGNWSTKKLHPPCLGFIICGYLWWDLNWGHPVWQFLPLIPYLILYVLCTLVLPWRVPYSRSIMQTIFGNMRNEPHFCKGHHQPSRRVGDVLILLYYKWGFLCPLPPGPPTLLWREGRHSAVSKLAKSFLKESREVSNVCIHYQNFQLRLAGENNLNPWAPDEHACVKGQSGQGVRFRSDQIVWVFPFKHHTMSSVYTLPQRKHKMQGEFVNSTFN